MNWSNFIIVIKKKKFLANAKWNLPIFYCLNKFKQNIQLHWSHFLLALPRIKKKSKIRAFVTKLRCFFPGAPIWSLFFSFELWATVRATVPPHRLPRARSRVTVRSPFFRHSFHNENFTLQQPLQIMHKVQVSNCNPWFWKWNLVYLQSNGLLYKKG